MSKPRYAYVTSVTPSYAFALNANFNSNKFYDTNADYIVLYDDWMNHEEEVKFRENASKSFPFQVKWIHINTLNTGCYHNSKYAAAATLQDDYDAVCLIDTDLFICKDTTEYFQRAANENILISAEHVWSGLRKELMPWGEPQKVNDRHICHIADFPVFINPKFGHKFFKDWKANTEDGVYGSEWQHPLVCFNRAIIQNFTQEQVDVLPGHLWVCDSNYWAANYEIGINEKAQMCITTDWYKTGEKTPVGAIHNKWWKDGRCNGEFAYWKDRIQGNEHMIPNLDRGQKNMGVIRDFMATFNNMTPATKREDYYKDSIDWRRYHAEWTGR